MEYPYRLEGVKSVEGDPLSLWAPDTVVREAELLLPRGSKVLDVGAGYGHNGTYLAMQGHEVISLEVDTNAIENGSRILRALGSVAVSNTFIKADMSDLDSLPEIQQVDAVIATRSLQQVEKKKAYDVVKKIQRITKPSGLNIIRGYIATKEQQALIPHLALFEAQELQSIYSNENWAEIKYMYDLKPLSDYGGKPGCQSTAELIAKKPSARELQKAQLIKQANYFRTSDAEQYNFLMDQADDL